MQIDNIINGINRKSSFKIVAFLILSFPSFQNYSQFQNILMGLITPEHRCRKEQNPGEWLVSEDECTLRRNNTVVKCSKWTFSSEPVGKTMISDYELICDKKDYGDLLLVVYYLTSVTSPLAGWLSDKYGRKKITLIYLLLETVSSVLLAFSSTFIGNMMLRFLLGISSCGISIAFVWLMESVNVEFRDFIGSFFWMFGCFGYMLAPLNVYFTKNWRITQLICLIPSVLYGLIVFVPESPRWLLASGKRKSAFNSIIDIASVNRMRVNFRKEDIVLINESRDGDLSSAFRSPVFVYRSMIAVLLQFSNCLFYSAVTINLTILSDNILLSVFLLGLMETPSLVLTFFSLRYLKRKTSLLIFCGIGSSLFWLRMFFHDEVLWQYIARIIIGCIAKTAICCVNQTAMTYIIELFPTSHRSLGIVWSQLFNFLSFILAIYINKLSSSYYFLPMTIYVISLNFSCLLAFYTLPETKGLPFPETLHDQTMLVIHKEEEFLIYMKNKYLDYSQYHTEKICSDNEEEITESTKLQSYGRRIMEV